MGLVYGRDLPVVDRLADLPSPAIAGSCMVTDPRGTGRYAYYLEPLTAATVAFWRIDLHSRARQQLTAPVLPAQSIVERARLLYDPTWGLAGAPRVCLIVPVGVPPFMSWQEYDPATNAWNALANIAGLAAALATDLSLAHACRTLGLGGVGGVTNDDTIVCNGDGGAFGGAALSNLACYSIAGNVWTLVSGKGGARGGAPAVGSSLSWSPQIPWALFSWRGGGSVLLDLYNANTDAWFVLTPVPAKAHGEGTEVVENFRYPFRSVVSDPDGQLVVYDLTGIGAAVPAVVVDTIHRIAGTDGPTHRGQALIAWQRGDALYLGVRPHSRSEIQRIQVPLP